MNKVTTGSALSNARVLVKRLGHHSPLTLKREPAKKHDKRTRLCPRLTTDIETVGGHRADLGPSIVGVDGVDGVYNGSTNNLSTARKTQIER